MQSPEVVILSSDTEEEAPQRGKGRRSTARRRVSAAGDVSGGFPVAPVRITALSDSESENEGAGGGEEQGVGGRVSGSPSVMVPDSPDYEPSPVGRKRSRARAQKRSTKAQERASKAQAKVEAKAKAAQSRHEERQRAGAFAEEEIAISVEDRLLDSAIGEAFREGVAYPFLDWESGASVGVGNGLEGLVSWRRRVMRAPGVLSSSSSVEPFVVLVWSGHGFVSTLAREGVEGIERAFTRIQAVVGTPVTRYFLLLLGAGSAMVDHLSRRSTSGEDRMLGGEELEESIVHLYVTRNLETLRAETAPQAAAELQSLTRAIATRPYREKQTSLATIRKVKVDWKTASSLLSTSSSSSSSSSSTPSSSSSSSSSSRPVFRGGKAHWNLGKMPTESKEIRKDPRAIFFAQLQMIRGVSPTMAANIVRHYPSAGVLMRALQEHETPKLLLVDILRPGRKEVTISKRIHTFYTTENPEEMI